MNSPLGHFGLLLSAPLHGLALSPAPWGWDTLNLGITNKKCTQLSLFAQRPAAR